MPYLPRILSRTHTYVLLLITVVGLLGGCHVRLVAEYDERIDSGVTDIHRTAEQYFADVLGDLGRDPRGAPYSDYEHFFREEQAGIGVLLVRAQAISQNDLTINQLHNLAEQVTVLDQLHQLHDKSRMTPTSEAGLLTPGTLSLARESIRTATRAILALEIAKRRGTASERALGTTK